MGKALIGRKQLETILKENDLAGNIEALTNSEGRYILSYKDLDTLRTRSAEASPRPGGEEGTGALRKVGSRLPGGPKDIARSDLDLHLNPIIAKWKNCPENGVKIVQTQDETPKVFVPMPKAAISKAPTTQRPRPPGWWPPTSSIRNTLKRSWLSGQAYERRVHWLGRHKTIPGVRHSCRAVGTGCWGKPRTKPVLRA